MADLKGRTLHLSSGKQIKLFGNSVAISKSLEIGEGYAPNILSLIAEQSDNKIPSGMSNPHKLTVEELMDLADFNMELWMQLKSALRKYGQVEPRIFLPDGLKATVEEQQKPVRGRKRKAAEDEGD